MPAPDRHFKEEIHELLDGRLDGAARLAVEQHLESCMECRREYEALRWTKQFAAARFAAASPAPEELRARILDALRAEAAPANVITPPPDRWRPLLVWASAAVLMLGAIIAFTQLRPAPARPALMAAAYRDYQAQRLPLDLATADVKEMEAHFASHGVPFRTRVFDLGMMQYQLVGGRVQTRDREHAALFVYRGRDGRDMLCEMFIGKMADLPAATEVTEHNGIRFQHYRTGALTAIFWPEGAVICVLISDAPPEQVAQLAYAKAMIPQ